MNRLKIVSIKKNKNTHKVYDLSVKDNNNFYIGDRGDILTHNCDFLTQPAQAALRNLIEEYSAYTRFILTCNYVDKLIEPLQSRCEIHTIKPPSKGEIAKHICINILEELNIEYDISDVATIIKEYYPDNRSIIKTLQQNTKDGKLTLKPLDTGWLKQLIIILSKREKNAWSQARQLIADAQVDDFQVAYRYMFDNMDAFANGRDAEVCILIDEYSYKANACPDKELNMAAFLSKLTELTKKQLI